MQDDSFLKTKLYTPPCRPDWVPRPGLMARLDAGSRGKLTVLSAPAGFGKTSLLRAWIQHVMLSEGSTVRTRFAWLSLDEGDNTTNRFLAYLMRALQAIDPGASVAELADQQLTQPAIQAALNRLLNEVDELYRDMPAGSRIVIILDDYHFITAEPINQILAYLLDHLPPQMHLIIATRADPPLPLARLRVRGQLLELRAGELRFSRDETRQFLNQVMGLNLLEKDLAALAARTEGWIAGLQMAALAMQNMARGGSWEPEPEEDRTPSASPGSTFISPPCWWPAWMNAFNGRVQ